MKARLDSDYHLGRRRGFGEGLIVGFIVTVVAILMGMAVESAFGDARRRTWNPPKPTLVETRPRIDERVELNHFHRFGLLPGQSLPALLRLFRQPVPPPEPSLFGGVW